MLQFSRDLRLPETATLQSAQHKKCIHLSVIHKIEYGNGGSRENGGRPYIRKQPYAVCHDPTFTMALQPSLSPFILSGSLESPHTLEFFYCFVCSHSARSANTLETIIKPLLKNKYPGKVKVIFRPQVQPWLASIIPPIIY
jgi:hypothetical protein